jgi:hypothetical protein
MSTEKAVTLKIGPVEGVDDLFEVSPTAVRKLQTDEIVIGLCAPAGSPVHRVAEDLERLLVQRYGYECEVIRRSLNIPGLFTQRCTLCSRLRRSEVSVYVAERYFARPTRVTLAQGISLPRGSARCTT